MNDEHEVRMKVAEILTFLTSAERTEEKVSQIRAKLEEVDEIMKAEVAA